MLRVDNNAVGYQVVRWTRGLCVTRVLRELRAHQYSRECGVDMYYRTRNGCAVHGKDGVPLSLVEEAIKSYSSQIVI